MVRDSFAERRPLVVFVLLAGAGLALMTVSVKSPEHVASVQRVGLRITGPLARAQGGLSNALRDAWRGMGSYRDAHHDLAVVQTENRDLRLALADRGELAAENERLRRLLDLTQRVPLRTVPALVVHAQRWPDAVLVIDKGSRAGIAEDMAVIAPDGVVGKVLTVAPDVAKVECITDPDAGLAAVVGRDRQQVDAIVTDATGGKCRLKHLDLMQEVHPGDTVVTSGLDQLYPKGLLVGTVESVAGAQSVEQDIVVKPAVDFSRLEEVLVVVAPASPAATPATPPRPTRELARKSP